MKASVATRHTRRQDEIDPFARDRKLFRRTDGTVADSDRDASRRRRLAKLKAAVVAIGLDGTRVSLKWAERLFREHPELRNA